MLDIIEAFDFEENQLMLNKLNSSSLASQLVQLNFDISKLLHYFNFPAYKIKSDDFTSEFLKLNRNSILKVTEFLLSLSQVLTSPLLQNVNGNIQWNKTVEVGGKVDGIDEENGTILEIKSGMYLVTQATKFQVNKYLSANPQILSATFILILPTGINFVEKKREDLVTEF